MKRLYPFFFAFLFATFAAAQNPIPNSGFETAWSGGKPTGWGDSQNINQVQPGHSGTFAAQGTKTNSTYPALSLGSGGNGLASTTKYFYLNLYYKFQQIDSEYLFIGVNVFDASQAVIGTGIGQITASALGFTFLSITINYSGVTLPAKYTINMTANSSGVNPVPPIGSSFTVDDVSLTVGQITSTNDKSLPPYMSLTLRTEDNFLEVQIEENKNDVFEIYNILGSKIKSLILSDVKTLIDISDIPKGVYIAVLKEENTTVTKKIHIVR